jgi:phospho-N-acetylmuramoyl-pentapeptide-transferase
MIAELVVENFGSLLGPIRLLSSITVLSVLGVLMGSIASFLLLPRLAPFATRDKGRNHAHDAEASVGKPLGVGIFIMLVFAVSVVLLVPANTKVYLCTSAVIVAALVGLADDVKPGGFGELTLGLSDLALSLFVSTVILWGGEPTFIWLPLTSDLLEVPFWVGVAIFTFIVWISINALNCTDGVDGLSGMLSLMTLIVLGFVLYAVVGNIENAEFLLIPFNPNASGWVISTAIMIGALIGYLWYNAPPSSMLMGDAGSRPIGLFIGMCVVVSGNPLLILIAAMLILVNGVTGLAKVAMIRIFGLRIFKNVSFPLHDHVRRKLGWSNSQVLVRFVLLHFIMLAMLLLLLLKVR